VVGPDAFGRRHRIFRALEARLAVDPYATLDVVLRLAEPVPLTLFRAIRARLDAATPSYLSRALAHRGEDLQRRLVAVIPSGVSLPADYLGELMRAVPVYRDQTLAEAAGRAAVLGLDQPNARVTDRSVDRSLWAHLAETVDPEAVAFADRRLEARWQAEVLGYGEWRGG
jgi:hypothetical protein